MEIILKDTNEQNYLKRCLESPWGSGTLLVASSANDSIGIGNLLMIPYEELREINHDEEGIRVKCETTEGIQEYEVYDIVFIGDLQQWCKEQNVNLIIQ